MITVHSPGCLSKCSCPCHAGLVWAPCVVSSYDCPTPSFGATHIMATPSSPLKHDRQQDVSANLVHSRSNLLAMTVCLSICPARLTRSQPIRKDSFAFFRGRKPSIFLKPPKCFTHCLQLLPRRRDIESFFTCRNRSHEIFNA